MNLFFELIEIYTGGHPRMVARLLKYFDKTDIDFSNYFESNEIVLDKLFLDIKNNFFKEIETTVLSRYIRNQDLLTSICNVLNQESYLLHESITYNLYFSRTNPKEIFKILFNILSIYNSKSNMIQLSPRDIIDSVGILYYDKYDTLSDNNYPIPEHLKT